MRKVNGPGRLQVSVVTSHENVHMFRGLFGARTEQSGKIVENIAFGIDEPQVSIGSHLIVSRMTCV